MKRHIIYIINPISGTRSKKNLRELVETKTKAAGISFQIFPSVASGDYSFLQSIITEENVTDIVIAGGDGTVSQVVNSLMDYPVQFGIIPCGSGNGLAYAAKIPKQPEKALAVIFNNKAVAIDGFRINGQFSCMLSGVGFDAKVAHDFAEQSSRGLSTYIKQIVKNFLAAKAYPFTLEIGDRSFPVDAYFISIANSNQFGNHFTIAPKASLSDGLLDIVIVTQQSKISLLFQTLLQVAGKNKLQQTTVLDQKKGIIYFQTAQLKLMNTAAAPLHIDGDPVETATTIEIVLLKKCFRLIQPQA